MDAEVHSMEPHLWWLSSWVQVEFRLNSGWVQVEFRLSIKLATEWCSQKFLSLFPFHSLQQWYLRYLWLGFLMKEESNSCDYWEENISSPTGTKFLAFSSSFLLQKNNNWQLYDSIQLYWPSSIWRLLKPNTSQ